MRRKIYKIIGSFESKTFLGRLYDLIMMIVIFLSIVPLAFKNHYDIFYFIEHITLVVFVTDYILRLCTADLALNKKGILTFFIYPITPMAIIDLLSILPSITILNSGLKLLRVLRLIQILRMFRIFKLFRYSKSIIMIISVLKQQKSALFAVCTLAVGYILISALVVFNVEPESFDTFFNAVYWATVSLTTVGYGDIYPTTPVGQVVTMISSVLGIAIVALPAGIITAGYMKELENDRKTKP